MEALENFIMSYINSQVQVPVVTQIRSASDRPIAYVMGTSWLDRHAVTRIAYRLKGLTLLVIVKDEDLKKKLTKDDYTTVVLKYDGISKEIKSTAEDEILSEIVESLPKSESIDSEKLKEIRSKLRNNQIEPWVLHFTSGTSEKLVIHKLKTKFRDINFGEIDCSRWAQLCLSLQVESPPAWALIKRGGNYQKLTVTSYQELATQLPQALKAHNLQTLSTSEFLRILDGDVNTWIIAVIPQHSSWNQVAEAFTETSLYYQHLNLQVANFVTTITLTTSYPSVPKYAARNKPKQGCLASPVHSWNNEFFISAFGVMLCSSSSEVYCHRLTNHHPVVIVQNGTRRYTHADNLDQESIIKFIDTLRETADIHISETEVLEISSSKRKHVWLVAFLPPWCGHNCDVLENEWRNVAKK
ncbi:DnaJ homolog subfamily C member 10, partial [Eumeta japonica]